MRAISICGPAAAAPALPRRHEAEGSAHPSPWPADPPRGAIRKPADLNPGGPEAPAPKPRAPVPDPKPASVRYNDWDEVALPPLSAFTPALPVSVIIPSRQTPAEVLARTLAALEGQTYPRGLFEVVIVDDGSEPPLAAPAPSPRSPPLDVRVVRQERRGFGLPGARNAGARAAAHDVLLFLDSDLLAEAGWIAAHARWHHAVSDALTIGFYAQVDADGLDPDVIGAHTGPLEELLADRAASSPQADHHMARTRGFKSRADDLFAAVAGGNLGVRKDFYRLVGGHDESFTRYGPEDVEFAYRAGVRGGLLVPVREAFAWHQGRAGPGEAEARRARSQLGRAADLIAHPLYRRAHPGRTFAVPQYTVTIDAGRHPARRVVEAVERVLADRVRDLVVRVEADAAGDGERLARLQDEFGAEPRVRVAPGRSALAEFPATPFHVSLPVAAFARDVVHRLRVGLGDAVIATAVLPDGAGASITRAWALHRAERCGGRPADFGEARTLSAAALNPRRARWRAGGGSPRLRRWLGRARSVRDSRGAWAFVRWLAWEVRWRARARRRAGWWHLRRSARRQRARVKSAAKRITRRRSGPPPHGPPSPAGSPPRSPPVFDLQVYNPVGWRRSARGEAGALGPLERLPPGREAQRVIRRRDLRGLRRAHHVEDTRAFHVDVAERAGALARLAAAGVVVHLADDEPDPRLRALLGDDLHRLMSAEARCLDPDERELLGIGMRRAALKRHSSWARARRSPAPGAPGLPLVSILLATRRPRFLPWALASVAAQTYPALELVLALHGGPFAEVERRVAELPHPVMVVRAPESEPLGAVLGAATEASGGALLTKMDDDDAYGADHVWDLVLAHEYSRAQLVGKGMEFLYLAASDRTMLWRQGDNERYRASLPAGGAMLVARRDLDRAGGWRKAPRGVDKMLMEDVLRAGGSVYRTHGAGFMQVRHGFRHTWTEREGDDDALLARADRVWPGWNPAAAGIEAPALPYPAAPPARAAGGRQPGADPASSRRSAR